MQRSATNKDGSHRNREDQLARAVYAEMWPTPTANDDNKTPQAHLEMKRRMGVRDGTGSNRTAITSLQVMAKARSGMYPTPTVGDAEFSGSRNAPGSKAHSGVSLTDWARGDGGEGRKYTTPTVRDSNTVAKAKRGEGSLAAGQQIIEPLAVQVSDGGDTRGLALNPDWVEWLMSWVPGWTRLEKLDRRIFDAWKELQGFDAGAPGMQESLRGQAVRAVRDEEEPAEAPRGQGPVQQREGERADPVLELPREAALDRPMEGQEDGKSLRVVRGDLPVQEATGEDLLAFLREQARLGLTWWEADPADCGLMTRIGKGFENRKKRLMAIGNGQVPLCAAVAWKILLDRTMGG